MEFYFNIRYEFDKEQVHSAIAARLSCDGSDYICVADGNILTQVHRYPDFKKVVDESMFSVCDSGYVPLYLKFIYGIERSQYRGVDLMCDVVKKSQYNMAFVGTDKQTLVGLKAKLTEYNPLVDQMLFMDLPYRDVADFDYKGIADTIDNSKAQIVWVALGAPKQEFFMNRLKAHLKGSHVLIGVGAAFNFIGNPNIKNAPDWVVKYKLESGYRLLQEPKKQFKKLMDTIPVYPSIIRAEIKRKNMR